MTIPRVTGAVAAVAVGVLGPAAAAAQASAAPTAQVRSLYRHVLLAEYSGPAKAVCSALTPAGVRSFTAGGTMSCTSAFKQGQHVLRHKTAGVDDSGYTPTQWAKLVANVMAHLKVTVHGNRARAIGGQSGIPGRTTLVLTSGRWRFSSGPPSIQP